MAITADYTGDGHGYAGQYLPKISNVTFRDMDLLGCSTPVTLQCNSRFPCANVTLDGVKTTADFVVNNTDCTARGVAPAKATGCAPGLGKSQERQERQPNIY